MAKKKTTSSRVTQKRAAKKVTKKKAVKTVTTKSTATRKPAKSKTAKSKTAAPASNSVDGILKKYDTERSTRESQLRILRKKIGELQARTRSYQDQIAKLSEQENNTREAISQLDSRRDREVSSLLLKLGVHLDGGRPTPAPAEPLANGPDETNDVPADANDDQTPDRDAAGTGNRDDTDDDDDEREK